MFDVALDSPQVASYCVYRCRVSLSLSAKKLGPPHVYRHEIMIAVDQGQ